MAHPSQIHPDGRRSRGGPVQVALIVATVTGSWLGMQAAHELGHVLAAWLTGGQVERVVLYPLDFSRTDLGANPHPGAVAWSGPMLGALFPLALWSACTAVRLPGHYLLRFFAGFCLVANGGYLLAGSFTGGGDAGDILRSGAPPWALALAGLPMAAAGLALWHGQGRHFGLGDAGGRVSIRAAWAAAGVTVCWALLAAAISSR